MMRDRLPHTLALVALLATSPAVAADAGAPASSASARKATPAQPAPAGHPEEEDGHAEAPPHGHGHGGGEMFQPPEDASVDDPSLPPGTLDIHIVDAQERPVSGAVVTLGILYNSIAKGESRKRVTLNANAEGVARAEHLESGSAVAYRPMVITDGATFSAMPFRLPDKTGMRATLHVYPVESDIEEALVVTQSVVYAEVKDDRIQVQEAFKIYNFGKSAWVPKDLVVPLPENFTAFTSQQGMSDIGVEAVQKKGVRLHGTFVPGQHVVEFRWQLPYEGEREVGFDIGMPPRMAAARVMAPASKDMKLEVPGFPPPQSTTDGQGQRILVTERQLRKDDTALKSVALAISGLPSDRTRRIVGTVVAALVLLAGLFFAMGKRALATNPTSERKRHLQELEELERAHRKGDVGPKTYEKERRRILDALAQTFVAEAAAPPTRARRRRAA